MIRFFDSNGDPVQTFKHDHLLERNDGVRVKLGVVHLCDELQSFKARHVSREKTYVSICTGYRITNANHLSKFSRRY